MADKQQKGDMTYNISNWEMPNYDSLKTLFSQSKFNIHSFDDFKFLEKRNREFNSLEEGVVWFREETLPARERTWKRCEKDIAKYEKDLPILKKLLGGVDWNSDFIQKDVEELINKYENSLAGCKEILQEYATTGLKSTQDKHRKLEKRSLELFQKIQEFMTKQNDSIVQKPVDK